MRNTLFQFDEKCMAYVINSINVTGSLSGGKQNGDSASYHAQK